MATLIGSARLQRLGLAEGSPEAEALEASFARAVALARAAHPSLDLPPDEFADAALAGAQPGGAAAAARAFIDVLHAADLWLARACVLRLPGAAEALEGLIAASLRRAVQGLDASPAFADDVRQSLRDKLLVGKPPAGPGIGSYSGEGPLAVFVRVAARRAALNLRPARKPAASSERELHEARAATPDPETLHLRDKYGREFRAAFLSALRDLGARDRELLRWHYIDGLSGARIAETLGVAPSTVTRSLQSLRAGLRARARRHLEEKLQLSPSQIDSLAGLVLSQLHVSLAGALDE